MPGTINPNQNFVRNVNVARELSVEKASRPPGFYKAIVLDALTVLSALGVSFAYRQYLADVVSVWFLIGSTAVFGLFSVFESLLRKNWFRRAGVLLLETGALLGFVYSIVSVQTTALVGVIVFSVLLWGEALSYREYSNALELRFLKTIKPLLSKLTTAVVFFAIIFYLPQWSIERSLVPKEAFDEVFRFATGIANQLYPETRLSGSFQEFAESAARIGLGNSVEFRTLPLADRDRAALEAADETRVRFEKNLGTVIDPTETLNLIFYRFLVTALAGWKERLGGAFLGIWAVAAFFVLRGFGTIFRVVLSLVILFVYHMLLALDVIHIVGESRTHEVLEYS